MRSRVRFLNRLIIGIWLGIPFPNNHFTLSGNAYLSGRFAGHIMWRCASDQRSIGSEMLLKRGAFRSVVNGEMAGLFPEQDPVGSPMTATLREIQNFTGKTLKGIR